MAGGAKETPRQRMVGMMYLVLTAMLALQVSSSIMDKFIFLNASLENSFIAAENSIIATLEQIDKEAKESPEDKKLQANVKRANELRTRSKEIIDYMKDLKKELIEFAGDGIDEDGVVKNPKEEMKVEQTMVGPVGAKNGKGYELESKINGFVQWLNATYKEELGADHPLPILAEGNQNKAIYRNDPIQRDKDFANASFQATPVVAALAVLTQLQSEVLRYEQTILKKLGAETVPFDDLGVAVAAESNVLFPGEEFKAKMFLFATTSAKVDMTFNGSPIEVKNGVGEITQKVAGGGGYDGEGKRKVAWKGTLSFKYKGKDSLFTYEGEYVVVAPNFQIVTSTPPVLYLNCANGLSTISNLGANYNPQFNASNARAIPGGKKGDVVVVPTSLGKVVVTVTNGGNMLGDKEFQVKPVPPPTVALVGPNGPIDTEKPIRVGGTLSIQAIPDQNFAELLPNEARYNVTSVEVTQVRGGAAVKSQTFGGGAINFGAFDIRAGDGFSVKVLGVQRAMSTGGIENVDLKRGRIISFFAR